MFAAPPARFRLYTSLNSYTWFLRSLLPRSHGRSHEHVERLEGDLAGRFGVDHAICLPMARLGVYLAVRALIKPGAAVVMSPYTIADVVNMVISAGGRPVFADVDRRTANVDPADVERLIDSTTGAVLITHLHGLAADSTQIREICRANQVPLLEDAAQAFGAVIDGRPVGTVGDAGILSFGMYKNVNCWYGGALITNDSELATEVRRELSVHPPQTPRFLLGKIGKGLATDIVTHPLLFSSLTFWLFRYGAMHDLEWINRHVRTELDTSRHDELPLDYLARMTEYQARLVLDQLDRVEADSRQRIAYAALYEEILSGIDGVLLPPARRDSSHIYTYFPVQCESRDELLKWLMYRKRDVGAQHLKNCADLESFSDFFRDCPNARAVARSMVLLPTYPRYGEREVERTARAVLEFSNSPGRSEIAARRAAT